MIIKFKVFEGWEGISMFDINKINNFYKYLISEQIIEGEQDFILRCRGGSWCVALYILVDVIKNHPEVSIYRDIKKYNL